MDYRAYCMDYRVNWNSTYYISVNSALLCALVGHLLMLKFWDCMGISLPLVYPGDMTSSCFQAQRILGPFLARNVL